jgi:hypothetical protein
MQRFRQFPAYFLGEERRILDFIE